MAASSPWTGRRRCSSPSFPYRLTQTVIAFYLSTCFVVIGVAAYYLRIHRFMDEAKTLLSMTFRLVTILVPLQIIVGDLHGFNTVHYQPAKIAAIEADWETQSRAPSILFAIPNEQVERNDFEITIPVLGSLYLTHDLNGVVKGLKEWSRKDRPPVAIVFFAFRIMVGMGLLMLVVVGWSWALRWRGRLYESPWFLTLCRLSIPLGLSRCWQDG